MSSPPTPFNRGGLWPTVKSILQQGWPVLIGQWASMAFGVLDTVMTGHASPVALAAMSLAVSIYVTVFIGLTGVLHALIPIIAQHFGAQRLTQIGHAWGQGVWLALALSVFGALFMMFPDAWLAMSGEVDPAVRKQVAGYLYMLILALPAALIFRTVYSLNTAISRPKVIMAINILGIGLKVIFNWLFIYGKLGMPQMGAVGAGLSTALVFWSSVGVSIWILRRDKFYAPFSLKLGRPDWKSLKELLRLGVPMGGSYLIEVTSFTFMALLVAREGIYATGGHQIMANMMALCFMMPLAFGISSAALTAQAIGAGDRARARLTGTAGLVIAATGAVTTIALAMLGRNWIVSAYTSDPAVATVALGLFGILAAFHMSDALQCMTSYLLRAHKIAVAPMLIQAGALWGIGLLGGWWLGFGPGAGALRGVVETLMPGAPIGAATMWLMAASSMALSATLLQYWYWRVAVKPSESARGST